MTESMFEGNSGESQGRNLDPDALEHLPPELLRAHVDEVEEFEADVLRPHPGERASGHGPPMEEDEEWDH